MEKKIITIIPARGGSKRFPGKNIFPLDGKPLIWYPIDAALQSSFIDRVIVSTDSLEIAEVSKNLGAEVPFMRPEELATDQSPVIDTIRYTLERLHNEGYHADYVLLLQAASPVISSENIDRLITLALENNADSAVAVSSVDTLNHPDNIRQIGNDGHIKFWREKEHYENLGKGRAPFYKAANMWLSSYATVIEKNRLEGEKNLPLIVDSVYSMDIDYFHDLEVIEVWMKYQKQKKEKI